MTVKEIEKLIKDGEKINIEFKESKSALTRDVFDTVCAFNNRNGGHILSISKVFREIRLADELGSGMRNTYKFTELYSSEKPIFEEGNIFKTIVLIKTIATKKVGIKDVAQDVAQKKEEILAIILHEIKRNPKISRKKIAEKVGVSVKTIERYIKEIQNLKFIGRGSNGYWKLKE